jgi:hypothetical protein
MLAWGQKNLSPELLGTLSSSYDGVLALYKMMKADDPSLQSASGVSGSGMDKDLSVMMRDPKYWRDRDPKFIAKVTEGFERLYGNGA